MPILEMKKLYILACAVSVAAGLEAQTRLQSQPVSSSKPNKAVVAPSYAWELLSPLGLHTPSTIDTTLYNYFRIVNPYSPSIAYASTGNYGCEGINMIFDERAPMSDFFFRDALLAWLPMQGNHRFYNTRIPMTLLSYSTGGGRETTQDRLTGTFSGNVNSKLQIGANVDYIYSKGSYANQSVKNFTWGFSASYIGDRYEGQAFFNHYNSLNKENGGITDDLYITDPAQVQGGQTSVDTKTIPTNLSDAHNRLRGGEFYMNHRYKVGYWHVTPPNDTIPSDTVEHRTYIPVTSFVWTFDYRNSNHKFLNTNSAQEKEFWKNHYFSNESTDEFTKYYSISNTLGISLLEGFHKYAKAGLAAYLTHEMRRFRQVEDSIALSGALRPEGLTPYPFDSKLKAEPTENYLWAGVQLTKQRGALLRYDIDGKIGVAGEAAGEVIANGNVSTRFRLLGDSVTVTGFGHFSNRTAPLLMRQYVSNHFIWSNDFGKTRCLRFGGRIDIPHTGTALTVSAQNVQNLIYFNSDCMPVQHGGSVQIFNASLEQNFSVGILNWRNRLTYQTSSDENVVSLPKFSIYSNLYLLFTVARVLHVQFGVDCDYYTKYYAPGYQPATMAFYNQHETKVGNYPYMSLYANMKLKKARFFVVMDHINQGLTGKNYFSMPHYPMNPRTFRLGISVDFAD